LAVLLHAVDAVDLLLLPANLVLQVLQLRVRWRDAGKGMLLLLLLE
jgi:hypothetical protein